MPIRMLVVAFTVFAGSLQGQAVAVDTQTGIQGASEKISVFFDNSTLADAIWTIARRSGTNVTFDERIFPARRVSYRAENVTPDVAFAAILKGTGLKVNKAQNGTFVVVDTRYGSAVKGQGVIAGKVTDAKSGKGISGATVSTGSDMRGVITDENGGYRLVGVVAGNHVVTVRLVGYAKQTRTVTVGEGATVTVDFKLEPSASVLDQVVVTGTVVSTELKAVPNAITVVTAKQIEERGITRIDQLFRGEIPGLFSSEIGTANPITGGPSLDEVLMFSRGATSISTSIGADAASAITNPIKTYIDGIEMSDPKYLSQIDPKSIERIEILTGPQASTIYGANAINGVMQIFTKRGSTQRPSITLSLSGGWVENSLGSSLSPSHQYDGTVSGMEGKLSYNVGAGWNYTGAWSPGKQLQRTGIYGGGRYQTGVFSLDVTARRSLTRNKVEGAVFQVQTELSENGTWSYAASRSGLIAPVKVALDGHTLGATLGYTPFSWWSHTLNLGTDASDVESIGSGPRLRSPDDTLYSNSQTPNSRISQSYSSTLRFPVLFAQTTLVYGLDHWITYTNSITWNRNLDGLPSSPVVTPSKPGKNAGMYIQGQFALWDALFLTYGVRTDWNPNYGGNARVRPGRYGVAYSKEFGDISAKMRGSYGRSIRPPGPGQVQGTLVLPNTVGNVNALSFYGVNLYSTLPSPDLGPEFQQGGEGGLELYFGSRASFVITRYNQTVDGLIQNLSNTDSVQANQSGYPTFVASVPFCDPSLPIPSRQLRSDGYCYYLQSQYLNVASLRNHGWETHGSLNIGPFTTSGTYSWNTSRVIGITPQYQSLILGTFGSTSSFTPGQTFDYVPEHTWSANISYVANRTSVSLNVNGLGEIMRRLDASDLSLTSTNNVRLRAERAYRMGGPAFRQPTAGYATANLNASQRLLDNMEVNLQVINLANYYQNDFNYQYPVLGRQSRLGIRLKWN